jgi:hypothetical protein
MFIANFFFGLLIVTAGILGVRYNSQITHMFPKSQFLEQRVGMGATFWLFYGFAFLAIIFGFLMMFSLHDDVLQAIFGPIADAL